MSKRAPCSANCSCGRDGAIRALVCWRGTHALALACGGANQAIYIVVCGMLYVSDVGFGGLPDALGGGFAQAGEDICLSEAANQF